MILDVTKEWEGETASDDDAGGGFVQVWLVLTSEPGRDSCRTALMARGLPRKGTALLGDRSLVVNRRNARRRAPCVFEVTVSYSQPADSDKDDAEAGDGEGDGDTGDIEKAPWDLPEEWELDYAVSMEARDRDKEGKWIGNSSGEPYDQPVADEQYDMVLICGKALQTLDLETLDGYQQTTNADRFLLNRPAGQVRVRGKARIVNDTKWGPYVQATFEFRIRRDGWGHRRLDAGYCELTGQNDANGKPIRQNIVDQNGQKITSPVKLDGKGKRLAADAKDVWNDHKTLPQAPFANLGIQGPPAGLFK